SKPIFSFTEEKIKSRAGETFSLTFVSNKEVKEATIHLPKEASIVKASLPVGVTVEELEEDYWLLRSDEYRATFTIPLVVEEEGTYEAFTSNEKTTMEITPLMTETHSGGKLLNQDESTDSEENFDEIVEENTSNELEEIRSDNEMSYILTESGIANVSDWTGFAQALGTPSISTIEIKQDFEVPTVSNVSGFITGGSSNPSGGEVHVNLTPANSSRTLTVNGNGHHIDFGAVTINAARATHNAQSPWDITFNDLTVYSGNWWGFFTVGRTLTVAQQSETRLALNNVESIGNQLFAPYYANVELFGVIENHVVESYTSAFRNNFNVNTGNTVNIES
ncbi:pectate lyase-like adhesive domain-containing protein, partial [Carnobacterium maltaromaticum]